MLKNLKLFDHDSLTSLKLKFHSDSVAKKKSNQIKTKVSSGKWEMESR
jgi:hypothetical protein